MRAVVFLALFVLTTENVDSYSDQGVGLSVGQAARLPNTPDRPSRPPDKGQTGID
jgi:hypothetical protein